MTQWQKNSDFVSVSGDDIPYIVDGRGLEFSGLRIALYDAHTTFDNDNQFKFVA